MSRGQVLDGQGHCLIVVAEGAGQVETAPFRSRSEIVLFGSSRRSPPFSIAQTAPIGSPFRPLSGRRAETAPFGSSRPSRNDALSGCQSSRGCPLQKVSLSEIRPPSEGEGARPYACARAPTNARARARAARTHARTHARAHSHTNHTQ